jgi:HTH-type transcriptional regulator/antitoxin HigA
MEDMITTTSKLDAKKYGKLLSSTLPAIIKTEDENDRAILLVENLLAKGDKLSYEETTLLELLGKLIADFEERFYRPRDASPQEILIELMQARDLNQTDLVEVLGSKSRVSDAVNGKREISKTQAKALAAFFEVSVELFI